MSERNEGALKELTRIKIKEPRQYQVIMWNDDFTSMEFVVEILIDIFHKDPVNAEILMMKVHKSGSAVVGKYPYDIAMSKVSEALERAKEKGFPFRMTVEEA
ncbi:MAG: ATP-dependent Clp protease adaptor ClpS [Lachnospiraceae bacterium]|nr:ATP-dependent Clp protease adaptor ClpS [Lachnospiraceae bacterium]